MRDFCTSVRGPASGLWSNLKSPVCTTRPAGQSMINPTASRDAVRHAEKGDSEGPQRNRRLRIDLMQRTGGK